MHGAKSNSYNLPHPVRYNLPHWTQLLNAPIKRFLTFPVVLASRMSIQLRYLAVYLYSYNIPIHKATNNIKSTTFSLKITYNGFNQNFSSHINSFHSNNTTHRYVVNSAFAHAQPFEAGTPVHCSIKYDRCYNQPVLLLAPVSPTWLHGWYHT